MLWLERMQQLCIALVTMGCRQQAEQVLKCRDFCYHPIVCLHLLSDGGDDGFRQFQSLCRIFVDKDSLPECIHSVVQEAEVVLRVSFQAIPLRKRRYQFLHQGKALLIKGLLLFFAKRGPSQVQGSSIFPQFFESAFDESTAAHPLADHTLGSVFNGTEDFIQFAGMLFRKPDEAPEFIRLFADAPVQGAVQPGIMHMQEGDSLAALKVCRSGFTQDIRRLGSPLPQQIAARPARKKHCQEHGNPQGKLAERFSPPLTFAGNGRPKLIQRFEFTGRKHVGKSLLQVICPMLQFLKPAPAHAAEALRLSQELVDNGLQLLIFRFFK